MIEQKQLWEEEAKVPTIIEHIINQLIFMPHPLSLPWGGEIQNAMQWNLHALHEAE